MRKIKRWLWGKFLPDWCRDELLEENRCLQARIGELKQETARLEAYIDGAHDALRLGQKITIRNGGGGLEHSICTEK